MTMIIKELPFIHHKLEIWSSRFKQWKILVELQWIVMGESLLLFGIIKYSFISIRLITLAVFCFLLFGSVLFVEKIQNLIVSFVLFPFIPLTEIKIEMTRNSKDDFTTAGISV